MIRTAMPYIDPPIEPDADCDEYSDYRPGDECPRCGEDSWAICGHCERHVTYWQPYAGHAIRVWGYRDPEPGEHDPEFMFIRPAWWCPECVAEFELSRDILRCRECGDGFHPDMDCVHGGICDGCREKGE